MKASRDNNYIPTFLATSNGDGVTPIAICADDVTHAMCILDAATGSDLSAGKQASRDVNMVVVGMAVSSVDGKTPVAIYADAATNKILAKST